MAQKVAQAHWRGDLTTGAGKATLGDSGTPVPVTWKARTEDTHMTSPEEFLAAAHCSCLAMAFTHALNQVGHTAEEVNTKATYTFTPGVGITGAALELTAKAPQLDENQFQQLALEASEHCPVSVALASVPKTFTATRYS